MDISIDELPKRLTNQNCALSRVITANQRQSRMLKTHLLNHVEHATELPKIESLTEWVTSLWQDQQFLLKPNFYRSLLNTNQVLWAWHLALKESKSLPPLIDSASLARQLIKAEDIHDQYLLDLEAEDASLTDETRFYLEARTVKNRILDSWKGLSVAQAAAALIDEISHNSQHSVQQSSQHEKPTYVFGFVEIPPLYKQLIEVSTGQAIHSLIGTERNQSCTRVSLPSEKEELQYAAHWANETLEKHPKQSVAIVVPDLNARHEQIRLNLYRAFEASSYLQEESTPAQMIDLSIGDSLWDIKIIKDAVSLLRLFDNRISTEVAMCITTSPYWASGDQEVRVKAQERLCQHAQLTIALPSFIQLFQNKNGELNTHDQDTEKTTIHECLVKIRSRVVEAKKMQSPANWVNWFLGILELVAWPGESTLSSKEYQHTQTFIKLLQNIRAFDALSDASISLADFRSLLEENCLNQTAQIELKNPKIRVMGLMEAAGQRFDHCLILSMTDAAVPESAKPNPFLPVALQKAHATPRSSIERELAYSIKLLETIKSASKHLVLSRFLQNELGETQPSPLLALLSPSNDSEIDNKISSKNILKLGLHKHTIENISFSPLEEISIGRAPHILPGSTIKGGASHLSAYWANPLFAFFRYRLGIDMAQVSSIGLSPALRGNLTHQVLELIYENFPSKDKLLNFVEQQDFVTQLNHFIHSVWSSKWKLLDSISPSVESYEKNRLTSSIAHFLVLDTHRKQNFEIKALEQKVKLNLSAYSLDIRIDRIDEIETGELFVIDYKTGKNSLSNLSKQDTADYQLPLYAISQKDTKVAAVAFAELSETNARFLGVCNEGVHISGLTLPNKIRYSELPEDWPETIQHWQQNAESLITQIAAGEFAYNPRNKSTEAFTQHYEQAVRAEEREFARGN